MDILLNKSWFDWNLFYYVLQLKQYFTVSRDDSFSCKRRMLMYLPSRSWMKLITSHLVNFSLTKFHFILLLFSQSVSNLLGIVKVYFDWDLICLNPIIILRLRFTQLCLLNVYLSYRFHYGLKVFQRLDFISLKSLKRSSSGNSLYSPLCIYLQKEVK